MIIINEATIPIILSNRILNTKILAIAGIMQLLAIVCLFITDGMWRLWIFIGIIVFRLVLSILRSYKVAGSITLLADKIVIEEEVTTTFKMAETLNMQIRVNDIGGYTPIKGFFAGKGSLNYLQFEYQGQVKKYEILLMQGNLMYLNAFFEAWEQSKFDFTIRSRFGKILHQLR